MYIHMRTHTHNKTLPAKSKPKTKSAGLGVKLVCGKIMMDLARKATVLVLTVMAISGVSMGSTVYTVGEIGGWTSDRDVDYYDWAASREFRIGDILHFQYDPGFHNVVQVSREDYHACDATHPIATYSSGNDYIKITRHGHYFFICGCPDHCSLTHQKLDIRVPKDDLNTN